MFIVFNDEAEGICMINIRREQLLGLSTVRTEYRNEVIVVLLTKLPDKDIQTNI